MDNIESGDSTEGGEVSQYWPINWGTLGAFWGKYMPYLCYTKNRKAIFILFLPVWRRGSYGAYDASLWREGIHQHVSNYQLGLDHSHRGSERAL